MTEHDTKTTDFIYVIPGIMGSTLVDPKNPHVPVWSLNYTQLVDTLSADPEQLDPEHSTSNLEPGEVIRHASFFKVNVLTIYDKLIKFLEETRKDARVVPFPYDWRKSNSFNAKRLAQRIIEDRAHQKRVFLVAHSMGGLVALLAAQLLQQMDSDYPHQRIEKIINIGTPHVGSAQSFRALQEGSVSFNFALDGLLGLTRASHPYAKGRLVDLLPKFVSLFELLPPESREILSRSGKTIHAFDPNLWKGSHLSNLAKAAEVHQSLTTVPKDRLFTIYSLGHDTESGFELDANYRLVKPKFDKGDKVVTLQSSQGSIQNDRRRPVPGRVPHHGLPNHSKIHKELGALVI